MLHICYMTSLCKTDSMTMREMEFINYIYVMKKQFRITQKNGKRLCLYSVSYPIVMIVVRTGEFLDEQG